VKNLFKPLILSLLLAVPAIGVTYGSSCDVSVSLCDNAVNSAKVEDGTLVSADLSSGAGLTLAQMHVSALKSVDVNLTAAQLDTLAATPVTAIAAPGSGYVTQVMSATCFVDFVATRLEAGTAVLSFRYTDGSGVKATADVPNTTVELNADTHYIAVGASGVPVANAVIAATIDADVTSGDSIINCRLYYRTVQVSDI